MRAASLKVLPRMNSELRSRPEYFGYSNWNSVCNAGVRAGIRDVAAQKVSQEDWSQSDLFLCAMISDDQDHRLDAQPVANISRQICPRGHVPDLSLRKYYISFPSKVPQDIHPSGSVDLSPKQCPRGHLSPKKYPRGHLSPKTCPRGHLSPEKCPREDLFPPKARRTS